jgi:hypothetical protein
MTNRILLILGLLIAILGHSSSAWASDVNVNRLADAIYKAEASKSHPYGVLTHYKRTSPRQACINTIKHRLKHWKAEGSKGDFIDYLQKSYAPIGAENDPSNLNSNWANNVKRFYHEQGFYRTQASTIRF